MRVGVLGADFGALPCPASGIIGVFDARGPYWLKRRGEARPAAAGIKLVQRAVNSGTVARHDVYINARLVIVPAGRWRICGFPWRFAA